MRLKTTTYIMIGLLVAIALAELAVFAYLKYYISSHADKIPQIERSFTSYSDDYQDGPEEVDIVSQTVKIDRTALPAEPKVEIVHPDGREMNIVVNCESGSSGSSAVRHIKADTLIIVGKGMDVLVAE